MSYLEKGQTREFGIDIPNLGNLEEFNIDKITAILPDDYLKDIEAIARSDDSVQETIRHLNALPDMSEEVLEEQIINSEKWAIEHGAGFSGWLKIQEDLLNLLELKEFDLKMKARIEILWQWAEENNFIESKAKRLGWDK